MTKIIELAHNLGEAIAASDEIRAMGIAKDAYDKDEALQAKLAEYETERKLLAEEFSKEDDASAQAISDLKARLDLLGADIIDNANYAAFQNAKRAMDDLMRDVNEEISFCITGKRPEHCTHDCSTCGGCH